MSINGLLTNKEDSPISKKVGEFKRGWSVLVAAFFGVGVSLVSLPYYSSGIWVRPWQESFGWSRSEIGVAALITTVTLTLTLPFAGKLLDTFSARKVVPVSLLLYGLGLLAVSQMGGNIWLFYVLVAAYTIVGVASSPLAFTRVINAWFDRNRGLALGITLTSTGVAGALLPKFLTPFVETNGWRSGYMVLAFIVFMAIPLVWFWLRDNPLDLHQNRRDAGQGQSSEGPSPALAGFTFSEAFRQNIFWKMITIFFTVAIAVCGLLSNFIPLLMDEGISAAEAGKYASLVGASVVSGRLLTGFLIDRFFAPYVAAVTFLIVAIGCFTLYFWGTSAAYIGAIAIGFSIGSEVDLIAYLSSRYFGMRNYGLIYGFQYSSFSCGCGLSAVLIGYSWDVTGAYDIALMTSIVLLVIAALITFTLPRFPKLTV